MVKDLRRVYLDYAATTPIRAEVTDAMEPWLREEYGNPSSLYAAGRRARAAIDEAREIISEAVACLFAEVIFTSSGTEAANLAIVGAALANEDKHRDRILFSAVEHHCVLHTKPLLERLGYRVEIIPVDRIGRVKVDALSHMVSDDVLLVSVMHANNELGTLQPVHDVKRIASGSGAYLHCDIVQSFPITHPIGEIADLATISSHKIYGPKGAGALYIKAGTKIKPVTVGGGQERELRAGTENVAAIVGFGEAVRLLPTMMDSRKETRDAFRQAFPSEVKFTVPKLEDQLPGHCHLRLPGIPAETLLIILDRLGVSASSGAACSSGSIEPSHVLLACGYSKEEAREGLRFTFGRWSTKSEALWAASKVCEAFAQFNRPITG